MHGGWGWGVRGKQAGRQGLSEEHLEKMGRVAWSAFTWEVFKVEKCGIQTHLNSYLNFWAEWPFLSVWSLTAHVQIIKTIWHFLLTLAGGLLINLLMMGNLSNNFIKRLSSLNGSLQSIFSYCWIDFGFGLLCQFTKRIWSMDIYDNIFMFESIHAPTRARTHARTHAHTHARTHANTVHTH